MNSVDPRRQTAYRYLLYTAMLDIRRLRWRRSFWAMLWDTITGRVKHGMGLRELCNYADDLRDYSGELAEWLHNMAQFAATDFSHFDESYFWAQGYRLAQRYPMIHEYKLVFECRLFELEHGRWPEVGEGPNNTDNKIPPPMPDPSFPNGTRLDTRIISNEQQPKQSLMSRELPVRASGILLLVSGSVIAYFSVVSPFLAASNHEESVSTTLTGTGLTPLALARLMGAGVTPLILALGVVYTFFPARATTLLGHPQRMTRLGSVFSLVFALMGIPLYLWLKSRL
ncbi:MAG TPA: hypothetical protein VIU46_03565 [Gallionellaceae bacterium]